MGRIFLCLLTLCLSSVWGRSPCPLPHSLIPVESGFDIQKFTGIWQTVSLSGEADWTSKTWKIVQDSIGSISLVATGMGPRSTQCVPLTVYKLSELGEAGSYHMIDGDSHQQVHMKIVSTDYNYAVIHFCRHSDESVYCSQSAHVELWHRDKATLNNIGIAKSYAVDNLCLEDSSFVDLSAGLCNIPTLIADALRNVHHNNGYVSDQAENEEAAEADEGQCIVNDVKIQEDFKLEWMAGLWYEISRTRFTFNTQESGVSFHQYESDSCSISSLYTGTTDGECQTAIQGISKKRTEAGKDGDLLGRIGGSDGIFSWAPMKIVYADDVHMLFYACYKILDDGSCDHDNREVTLVGRSSKTKIDEELLQTKLKELCIQPADMVPTLFEADCSDWVQKSDEIENEQTADEKEECLVDSIKTADNFIVDKILGKWYVMHTNIFKSMGRHVVSMNIYQGQGELLHIQAVLSIKHGNVSCRSEDALLSPACGQDVGDFLISPPKTMFMFRQWLSFKVLYITDTVMATYQCMMEKPDGHCEKAGIIGYLLSRDPNQPIEEEAYLKNFLQKSSLGIETWKPVEDRCDHLAEDETKVEDSRGAECQAFAIPSQPNIDIKKTEGIWYLIATIPDRMFERESSVYYYYEGPFEGSKHLWQAGANSSGECQELRGGIGRLRCPSNPNRGDLNRFIFPNWWTFAPVKHLYTDYEKVMVMYICLDVDFGGHCLPESQRIFIMARQKTLEPETREKLDDIIRSACVDPDRVIDRDQLYDCTSTLEPEIAKINEAKKAEKDEAILECGLNYNKVAVIPECSLNDIKLATDFSMSKFLGTWYIVTSSYRLPIKPPAILRISQGVGDLLHLRDITHLPDGSNKCIMGDVLLSPNCGTVDGDFMVTHLRSTSPQAKWTTLKVLYASDTVAAVYQCVAEKPDGTCASVGGIGHILTRDLSVPIQKEAYLKSLLQDACVSIDHWVPITDYCEELQQTLSELGPESDTEARNPECQAFNIPPHQDIDLSRLQGTWYEMVKIHSPGFDWSSVMTHYEIDANGVLSITSIGVSGNSEECVQEPLMQVVRPRCSSDVSRGHYTKILAPGVWQFAPWKVLFTDYETIVIVYGCFDVDNFGHCIPDQQTLFFLTKDKVIEPDWKEKYDSVIQSACIDPQVITETEHSGDCSEELQEKIKEKEEPVLECRVDDIKLATDYSTSKLLGKWYVVASSFQKAIKQPMILRIRQGQGNPFHMRAVVRSPQTNSSCEMVDVQLHPRCEEDGDFFSTHSKDTSPKTLFTSMKVLYLTESVGAVYQCAYEKPDGTCHSSAVIGHILSRDLNIAVEEKEHIKDLFKQSCVSLEHLKTNEDYCEDLEHVMSEPGPESVTGVMHPECEVFAIPPHPNLDISQVAGYWYVMAKTSNFLMTWTSVVDYYDINDNGFLSFFSTGLDDNSTCGGPLSGIVRPKCRYTSDQYVSKLFLPGHWQFSPFTILYTDYDNTLIIYICGSLDAFGQCEQKERYVFLLQRDTTLEVDWRNKYSQYFSAACVDPSLMTEMRQDGNCKGTLEAAVAKRTESRAKATEVIQVDEDV